MRARACPTASLLGLGHRPDDRRDRRGRLPDGAGRTGPAPDGVGGEPSERLRVGGRAALGLTEAVCHPQGGRGAGRFGHRPADRLLAGAAPGLAGRRGRNGPPHLHGLARHGGPCRRQLHGLAPQGRHHGLRRRGDRAHRLLLRHLGRQHRLLQRRRRFLPPRPPPARRPAASGWPRRTGRRCGRSARRGRRSGSSSRYRNSGPRISGPRISGPRYLRAPLSPGPGTPGVRPGSRPAPVRSAAGSRSARRRRTGRPGSPRPARSRCPTATSRTTPRRSR